MKNESGVIWTRTVNPPALGRCGAVAVADIIAFKSREISHTRRDLPITRVEQVMADGEFVEDPDQRINNTTLSSGVDDAKSRFTDSAPRKPESVTKQVRKRF